MAAMEEINISDKEIDNITLAPTNKRWTNTNLNHNKGVEIIKTMIEDRLEKRTNLSRKNNIYLPQPPLPVLVQLTLQKLVSA